ncbi:MAG: YcxB family protein [Alphaproteobacteria bacterium]
MSILQTDIHFTEDDYKKYTKHICRKMYGKQFIVFFIAVILAMCISTFAENIIAGLFPEINKNGAIKVIIDIGGTIILVLMIAQYLLRYMKIEYIAANGNFLRSKTISIDEKGINEKTDISVSFFDWNGILHIENHNDMILLYIDSLQAYLIPKNIFETKEEEETFINNAEEFWKNAKNVNAKERKRPWDNTVKVSHHEEDNCST